MSEHAAASGTTRTIDYDDLRARLRRHYRAAGKIVDFHMPLEGGIVIQFRLRGLDPDSPWENLLPVGVYDAQYRRVLQKLAPILFPDEDAVIRSMVRHGDQVTIDLEPPS